MLNLGRESIVNAFGREWTVGRFELRILHEFRDWLKPKLDDPLGIPEAIFKLLPAEEQIARVKRAETIKRDLINFSSSCTLFKEAIATEDGAAEIARLMFSTHHPDMTADQALQIVIEAQDQFTAAVEAAKGKLPGNPSAPAA